jgi:DNA polymerase III alpha subunit (gram-positive type)
MKAFLFDCETTGLISNRKLKLDKQPHVIEFYGAMCDLKKGKVLDEVNTFIRPPAPELVDKTITRITGITFEEHLKDAPTFAEVAEKIFSPLERAPILIAHNLSFDKEMIEIEAERLARKLKWPKRLLCTVEQTIHIKGFRMNLSLLHEYLFGEPFAGAHRAKVDVEALLRCCKELVKRGVL